MAKAKKQGFGATTLRGLLGFLVVALIGLAGVGFYFAREWLGTYAQEVGQTVAQANSGGVDRNGLQQLNAELQQRQGAITKINQLIVVANSFESRTIADLNAYAQKSGITITDFEFDTTTQAGTGGSTRSVTIKLRSPMNFQSLLAFMSYTERNLPKMQITSMKLARDANNPASSIQLDSMIIEVYTR